MISIASLLLGLEPSMDFHGSLEVAGIYSEVRQNGGNEMSLGDYNLGLTLKASYAFAEIGADYASSVLDFNDPEEQNQHNQNWLRADGFVSRPWLLPWITVRFDNLHCTAGGFRSVGLTPLSPAGYYLLAPGSLIHSTHYDKGFAVGWDESWVRVEAALVDGDWAVGEADVLTFHDSRANSTPSVSGKIEFGTKEVYCGLQGIWGMVGSYPGQKRREDNLVGYTGIDLGDIALRAHGVVLWRNPAGDGSGSHVGAVRTLGGGMEALWRLPGRWDLTCSLWGLWGDGYDGEIWVIQGLRRVIGVMGGLSWRPWDPLRVGLEGGALFFDQPYAGTDSPALVVFYVKGEF